MKTFLLSLLCFLYLGSSAQIRLGIQTGLTHATFVPIKPTDKDASEYVRSSYTTNLEGGIKAELHIKKSLFLQSGLLNTSKGAHLIRSELDLDIDKEDENIFLSYIQLPVDIVYKRVLSKNVNVFAGAGVYGAYGIWGTESGTYTSYSTDNSLVSNYVIFTNHGDPHEITPMNVKPFDYGYSGLIGFDIGRFQITAKYSRGLTDLTYATTYMHNYRNKVFSISACYYFKWKL